MRIFLFVFFFSFYFVSSQNDLDQIVAIVGDEVILFSDIKNNAEELSEKEDMTCNVYKDIVFQKILIHQAKLDSIEVSENEIISEVDKRIDYFVSMSGSIKNVENYFNKSIDDIKQQLFLQLKDQFLIQRMQYSITDKINVSPSDVISFYNNIPQDSLPLINGSIEFAQIIMSPDVNNQEDSIIKGKLNEYKERLQNGEDFSLLAALYSQDMETSSKGGSLGFLGRDEMIPEFKKFVYAMDKGEISNIIKSNEGYHIVKLSDRSGEKLELSHILLRPKYNSEDIATLKSKLDSIKYNIEIDSLTFGKAAFLYSEDISKNNNGLVINNKTGSTYHTFQDVPYLDLIKMSNGQISEIKNIYDNYNNIVSMKILQVVSKVEEHLLDVEKDYIQLYEIVLSQKKNEELIEWIKMKEKNIFIKVNNNLGCENILSL